MFDPYFEWLQIPAERRPPDYYELLGLSRSEDNLERIHNKALERIAHVRRYQLGEHSEAALRLIGELSAAFDTLTKPDRKRAYDQELAGIATHAEQAETTTLLEPAASTPPIAIDAARTPRPAFERARRAKRKSPTNAIAAAAALTLGAIVMVAYLSSDAPAPPPPAVRPPANQQVANSQPPPSKSQAPERGASMPPVAETVSPTPKEDDPPPTPAIAATEPPTPPNEPLNQWIPIFNKPEDMAAGPNAKWLDGVIEINSGGLTHKDLMAGDAIIRARATKISGQNIALGLRHRDTGAYSAWFNGGTWFGISKMTNGRWSDVKHGRSKRNFDREFEFKFAAVGDKLSVWADDELVVEARDSTNREGWPAVIATKGRGRFHDVEIQVLDPAKPISAPPPVEFPPPRPPLVQVARSLFNGRDLSGWTPMHIIAPRKSQRDRERGAWSIEQQTIVCSTTRSVWLRSEREFGDFVLALEYKLPPGANSGVLLRARDVGGMYKDALEVQLIDDAANPNLQGEQRTGAIYGAIPSTGLPAKPAGEWNSLLARCQGQRVQVSINAILVVDADISQFAQLRDLPRRGYLGLYNWRGQAIGTAFRNITIQELE